MSVDIAAKQARARALWIEDKPPNEIAKLLGDNTTPALVKTWLRDMDIPERPTRPGARQEPAPAPAGPENDLRRRVIDPD